MRSLLVLATSSVRRNRFSEIFAKKCKKTGKHCTFLLTSHAQAMNSDSWARDARFAPQPV
jgi:hypothetical protein